MSSTVLEGVQKWNAGNIRKFTRGSIFVADYATGTALPGSPFTVDGTGLAGIPTGYFDCGYTTTDGVTFPRSISMNEVHSWQSAQVTQSDVETDTETVHFMLQEFKPIVLSLIDSLALSAAPAGGSTYAVSRAVTGDQPLRRVLVIAESGVGNNLVYHVKYFPQVKISAIGDETQSRGQEWRGDITMTPYPDPVLGGSSKRFVDGPGWRAMTVNADAATFPAT